MPLLDDIPLAADRHFHRTANRLREEATPRLPPTPLLQRPQTLARISPQPDRLVTVRSARVPLIEAARPLLEALTRLPAELDTAGQDSLHHAMARELIAFQSVAQEAHLPEDDVLMASYLLCAALDEAIGQAPWARGDAATRPAWNGRLSMDLHRARNGGEGFFLLLGGATLEPPGCLDLLELMLLLLALGFEGTYRQRHDGSRTLGDIRHQVLAMVQTQRCAEVSPRWRAIEGLLRWRSMHEVLAETPLEVLFS